MIMTSRKPGLDAGETVTVEVEYRGRTPSGGLRHA
jgi:hypothetical protein